MSDKPQIINSIPGEVWAAVGAIVTGFGAWLAKKLYEVVLEIQLEEIKEELKTLKAWQELQAEIAKKEIEILKAQVADLRATSAERKAVAEAQSRTLERILDRLERNT